jgi:hypothetical protein
LNHKEVAPKSHSYPLIIIQFCIALKLTTSSSFRAISRTILTLNIYLNTSFKAPSHSTILLWVKKYGYYQLSSLPITEALDWVLLIDESVQFGQNKLLLVYGFRQSEINFERPLNFKDLTTLVLASKTSWTGDEIYNQLIETEKRIGKISYIIADQGNSIKKAIKKLGVPHVFDITHYMSLIVEHIYKNDPKFKEYAQKLTYLRTTQPLSKMSHVLPPAQRHKARFMNLRPLSDWGVSVLNLLNFSESKFEAEKENLKWVSNYESLISEMYLLNEIINDIQGLLKTKGISQLSVSACEDILKKGKTHKLMQFRKELLSYLNNILNMGPQKVYCSSDIIESSFGKYKNYLQANAMIGITNLSLSLAAFTGSIENDDIRKIFEETKTEDVKEWTKINIGKTTLARRSEILKRGCRIKIRK